MREISFTAASWGNWFHNTGKSGLALLYWIQYISQKILCTKLQVWMRPAKLLHVPKCTTLIWNMDAVCIFFSVCITIYWLSFSYFFPLFLPISFSFFSFILFLCSFTVLVPLSLLYLTIRTYKQIFGLFIYSALPMSCGHFSPNNSRRTPIARSLEEIWMSFLSSKSCRRFISEIVVLG